MICFISWRKVVVITTTPFAIATNTPVEIYTSLCKHKATSSALFTP